MDVELVMEDDAQLSAGEGPPFEFQLQIGAVLSFLIGSWSLLGIIVEVSKLKLTLRSHASCDSWFTGMQSNNVTEIQIRHNSFLDRLFQIADFIQSSTASCAHIIH